VKTCISGSPGKLSSVKFRTTIRVRDSNRLGTKVHGAGAINHDSGTWRVLKSNSVGRRSLAKTLPKQGGLALPLKCENCGASLYRRRRPSGAAEPKCRKCGTVIPNSVLRGPTKLPPSANGEIQVAAREMVRRYGRNAARQAAKQASDMLYKGDLDSFQMWTAVIGAIQLLQAKAPADGEGVH